MTTTMTVTKTTKTTKTRSIAYTSCTFFFTGVFYACANSVNATFSCSSYDPAENKWSPPLSSSVYPHEKQAGVVANNKIYVMSDTNPGKNKLTDIS
jgi:hypothetical protein